MQTGVFLFSISHFNTFMTAHASRFIIQYLLFIIHIIHPLLLRTQDRENYCRGNELHESF